MSGRCRSAPTSRRARGDTGSNSRVDLFVGMIRDLAAKHGLKKFRLGYFYSEVATEEIRRRLDAGEGIEGLDGRPALDRATLDATDRVVAVAGIQPYIALLDQGADV